MRRESVKYAPSGADTFVNDVVVTPQGAYLTDSRRMVLYRVPLDLGSPRTLNVTGIPLQAGNNLNGIVATPDGRTLIAVQTNTGKLWRINPQTGAATAVDLGGATVVGTSKLRLVIVRVIRPLDRSDESRTTAIRLSRLRTT